MTPTLIIKIALVLDCTGSMEQWIQEAKSKIREIVASTHASHPSAVVEVALVAYRDYGDTMRRRVVDFTTAEMIEHILEGIHADGGDDEAEDIAGALERVCGLTWGPSDVRMVIHIADAPAHGIRFHAPRVSDRFPDGDPEGKDPLVSIRHFADQDIDVTFVRITSTTDVMIDVFHETYIRRSVGESRFRVIDLHPQSYDGRYGPRQGGMSSLLSPAVTRSVTEAVARHSAWQDK
jgi:hypothetical protein